MQHRQRRNAHTYAVDSWKMPCASQRKKQYAAQSAVDEKISRYGQTCPFSKTCLQGMKKKGEPIDMPLGKRISPSLPRAQRNEVPQQKRGGREAASPEELASSISFQTQNPLYSFDDMILNRDTVDAIQDVLSLYEKQSLLFDRWGLGETHKLQKQGGINLYGPSGTGKTMAAHAIAHQLGRKLLPVSYAQIESKYVGETAKNLTAMFRFARETKALLFFDEADALLSRRVTNMSNSTDVSVNQTRSVLLLLLGEFDDLVLFATNFLSNYDPAFLRRILAHIRFDLSDEDSRAKLWQRYIPPQMPTDADIPLLARTFAGITGADIANAVFSAALRAARRDESFVRHAYFEDAIRRVVRSREDHAELGTLTERRTVSEEYVKNQLGGLPK